MNRAEAQRRTSDIRSIRGSYAILRNIALNEGKWMPDEKWGDLQKIVRGLESLVDWLDEIRSERASIRAGVVCGKCKKKIDFTPDGCRCWEEEPIG